MHFGRLSSKFSSHDYGSSYNYGGYSGGSYHSYSSSYGGFGGGFHPHINLIGTIIHAMIYGIVFRILRNLSMPEIAFLAVAVILFVVLYNRRA